MSGEGGEGRKEGLRLRLRLHTAAKRAAWRRLAGLPRASEARVGPEVQGARCEAVTVIGGGEEGGRTASGLR